MAVIWVEEDLVCIFRHIAEAIFPIQNRTPGERRGLWLAFATFVGDFGSFSVVALITNPLAAKPAVSQPQPQPAMA